MSQNGLQEIIGLLGKIKEIEDVDDFYEWAYNHRPQIGSIVKTLNAKLRLRHKSKYEIKPDLPKLSIGSCLGTVILAMNPGWKVDDNEKENAECVKSLKNYLIFSERFVDEKNCYYYCFCFYSVFTYFWFCLSYSKK